MKRFAFHKSTIAISFVALLLASCTKDFEKINTDPNTIQVAAPQQLLAPALVNTLTYNMNRNRNFNNELMQVTVNMSDAEGQVFRYDYRTTWSDYLYNGWYAQLTNFKDIYRIASDSTGFYYNKAYMGVSLICQAWVYSLLTDTYGDVPFSQSNKALTDGNFTPAFDKQKDIYFGIFSMLEQANNLLSSLPATHTIAPAADPVYGGTAARWRKFGNSLYLRLLLRLSGKAEVATQVTEKIKDIVETNFNIYPIIASNDESAILRWTGVAPYNSPYLGVREQDWRAPGVASFFIENLKAMGDPRIDQNQWTTGINRWGIAPYQGALVGVPSGYAPGTVTDKQSYFYSNTQVTSLQTDPLTGMIMNYAEVKFILAEAALKGWISSSAETHYNDGVAASIKLWMPAWNVPITTYLQNPAGRNMQLSAAITLDDKMELIHLQKYYALFLMDLQQWFEYRRTGRPTLPKGPGLRNNGVMPARMTYPVYVQSTNPTNYQAAIAAQGPDLISTPVWWQKP